MKNGPRLTRVAAAFIAAIKALSLTAGGQTSSPANDSTEASSSLLPRGIVAPISKVNRFFPEVTREVITGCNMTAVANANPTRSVIYSDGDSAKKVTITVGQYPTESDASAGYQEAVAKSKSVPGFKRVSAEDPGPNAFVGTVTQAEETHIGLGLLQGPLIVGVTLSGYDPTPENIARLVALSREEERVAKAAIDRNEQK